MADGAGDKLRKDGTPMTRREFDESIDRMAALIMSELAGHRTETGISILLGGIGVAAIMIAKHGRASFVVRFMSDELKENADTLAKLEIELDKREPGPHTNGDHEDKN